MNLVTEAWIPVVRADGKTYTASLMQVFTEGKQFADLAVRPHERIALMRLFICIAQAALDGPKDIDDWDKAPNALPQAAKKYLEEWVPSFNLFDNDKPFLQISTLEKPPKIDFCADDFKDGYTVKALCDKLRQDEIELTGNTLGNLNNLLKKQADFYNKVKQKKNTPPSEELQKLEEVYTKKNDEDRLMKLNRRVLEEYYPHETPEASEATEQNPVSKLDFALATGANTTLFDHFGSPNVNRDFSTASLAIWLLTFQNFSPGGTIGVALWNGKPTLGWSAYPKVKPGQSSHAPCLPKNMLHAFIRRENLFNTILANLLSKETVAEHYGKDAWGHPIWGKIPSGIDDAVAIKNSTQTYLGRLVPLTRCIKLNPDGKDMLLANGLNYPVFDEDAKERFPAEPSATVIRNREGTKRLLLGASLGKALWRELSALAIARKNDKDSIGGPLTLRNIPDNEDFDLWVGALLTNKATILDTAESVFHIPANMRTDIGRAAYNAEVQWAESIAGKLAWAVETYRKESDGGWEGRLEMTKPQDRWKLREKLRSAASHHYWTAVEKQRPLLMVHVDAIGTTADAVEKTRDAWRKAVHGAARQAYQLSCGQETPRQIRAYALGLDRLFAKRKTDDAQEPETVEMED